LSIKSFQLTHLPFRLMPRQTMERRKHLSSFSLAA